MDIKEIRQKIEENHQKIKLIEKETDQLVAEEIAVKNKQKIDQFQIGMVVFDEQHGRIGKVTGFRTPFSEIRLECQGFDCDMDNARDINFDVDIDRASVISMPEPEFLEFKGNTNSRKQRYDEAKQHALNIKDACEKYYRNQINRRRVA